MSLLVALGLAGAAFTVVRARLAVATTVLLGVLFLVPGNLVLVGFPTLLPAFRVVLYAYVAGLVLRAVRGEIPADSLRPTRVQGALLVFLLVALATGVALTAEANPLLDSILIWLSLFDQLVTLTAVLVAARVLGVRRVAWTVAAFAVAVAVICVIERIGGTSYARWVFVTAGRGLVGVASEPLTPRGDQLRVRGPYQFSLEFSWVAVMLFPVVVAWAISLKRRVALLGPVLLGMALLWSWSRSSLPGVALALAVFAVASRLDRRAWAAVGGVAAIAFLVLLTSPGVRSPFDAANEDSVPSRTRRLAVITAEVVDEPMTGLGLAGLRSRDIGGADASYTLIYAGLGVPGLAALGIAHATAAATCVAGVRRGRRDRLVAAAALGGVAGGILGNFALDLVAVPGSGKTFWIVAALGAAVASARAPDDPVRAPVPRGRFLAVPAAVAVAMVVAAAWPTHVGSDQRFETIERRELAETSADIAYGGRFLVNTACDLIDLARPDLPDARIDCIESRIAPGVGTLRVQTGSFEQTAAVTHGIEERVREVLPGFTIHEVRTARGTPTVVRFAPLWVGMAALAAVLMLPGPRRRDGADDDEPSDPSTPGTRRPGSSPDRAPAVA